MKDAASQKAALEARITSLEAKQTQVADKLKAAKDELKGIGQEKATPAKRGKK